MNAEEFSKRWDSARATQILHMRHLQVYGTHLDTLMVLVDYEQMLRTWFKKVIGFVRLSVA